MWFSWMLQIVAAILSVIGIELNARKKIHCWWVWNLANVFWIWWNIRVWQSGENTLFAILATVTFTGYNIRGYLGWRKRGETK